MKNKTLCCSIKFNIEKSTLERCLCDYFYLLCGGFSEEERKEKDTNFKKQLSLLKKRDAIKIVKRQLLYYGLHGAFQDGFFEAANDVIKQRELWWLNVKEWTNIHYPFLK